LTVTIQVQTSIDLDTAQTPPPPPPPPPLSSLPKRMSTALSYDEAYEDSNQMELSTWDDSGDTNETTTGSTPPNIAPRILSFQVQRNPLQRSNTPPPPPK
jgi:hypothetical protein